MASYVSTSEFKSGLKVIMDTDPFSIIENEFVKPGKGQAFNRVKMRNLRNGRILEKTFKSGDSLEAADVTDADMQYLYTDGTLLTFMNPKTYEQLEISVDTCADAIKWIKEQDTCIVTLWNGQAITVQAPNFVTLKIVETDPGLKGDTSGGGGKPAKLETGAVVRVPLFVQTDDLIKVDTRNGDYLSRVK